MPFENACYDRDHVILLQKIDKLILAAEKDGLNKGIRTRIHSIRNLLVVHSNKSKDFSERLQETIKGHKREVLIGGLSAIIAISLPYFVITRTGWIKDAPLVCKSFPTKDPGYKQFIEVCVNGITRPYTPNNGDMELDLTFMKSSLMRQQADVTFWVADRLGEREVDYKGEYNTQRVRTFNRLGLLVKDSHEDISSWEDSLVPDDVREPLWSWVHSQRDTLFVPQPPFTEAVSNWVASFWPFLASLGSVLVTVYRFLRVG